jgi:hypothetical protein
MYRYHRCIEHSSRMAMDYIYLAEWGLVLEMYLLLNSLGFRC